VSKKITKNYHLLQSDYETSLSPRSKPVSDAIGFTIDERIRHGNSRARGTRWHRDRSADPGRQKIHYLSVNKKEQK